MKKKIIKGALFGLTAGIIATFFDGFYMLIPDMYVPAEYPVYLWIVNISFWLVFGCAAGLCVHFRSRKKRSRADEQHAYWLVWFLIPFTCVYGILGKLNSKVAFNAGFDHNLVFLLAAVFIGCVIFMQKKYSRFRFGTGLLIPEILAIVVLFHFCSNLEKNPLVLKSFTLFFQLDFFADPARFSRLLKLYSVFLYGAGVGLILCTYTIVAIKGVFFKNKLFRSIAVILLITVVSTAVCFQINRTLFLKQYNQVAGMQSSESKRQLPPVILIVLDTLRKRTFDEHPEIYKNLMAFSRDSLVFDGCISNSSWTLPSHASLFTGLALQEHGADQRLNGPLWLGGEPPMRSLGQEFTTLAEVLNNSGYNTAAIISNFGFMKPSYGLNQGFQMYDWFKGIGAIYEVLPFRPLLHNISFMTNIKNKFVSIFRKAEDVNDAVDHFLRRVPPGPFFLFINYMDSHEPYRPSQPFKGFFIDDSSWYRYPLLMGAGLSVKRIAEELRCTVNELLYKGDIAYLDYHIGVLLDRLKETGLYDDALIVITSDHGELFCEHGYSAHRQPVYEGVVRVPLFIKFPQQRVTGTEKHYMTIADIYPTILTICGMPLSDTISAKPFGKPAGPVVTELYRHDIGAHRAIYVGRYKYMKFERAKENALYDLVEDPLEQNNIAGSTPEIVAQMETMLAGWLIEHPPLYEGVAGGEQEQAPVSLRHLDDLKALGYIQ